MHEYTYILSAHLKVET